MPLPIRKPLSLLGAAVALSAVAALWAAPADGAEPAIATALDALDRHLERHPEAAAADVYKLLHQSVMGPGHAIDSVTGARAWLERELAGLGPAAAGELVCEPLGGEPPLVRVHLRPFVATGAETEALLDAFVESANSVSGEEERLSRLLDTAVEHLADGGRSELADELGALAAERRAEGFPATHHSAAFSVHYQPAYRLVRADLAAVRSLCDARSGHGAADTHQENRHTMQATGTFEVALAPLDTYSGDAEDLIGRMSIDKTFAGDLAGSSRGEMLSGGSPAQGSAGYVAIERVTGALGGRNGSFLLQHSGTMSPESQQLTITVIPGSGSGELEGIAGSMTIRREEGRHFYDFEYTLPD